MRAAALCLLVACGGEAEKPGPLDEGTAGDSCAPPEPCPEPEPSSFDSPFGDAELTAWVGDWEGLCEASGYDPFDVRLSIAADGQDFSWDLTYEGQPTRAYTMRPTADPQRWVLDENNGILIDHFLVGDQLMGLFTVSGQHIGFHWLRSGDRLDVLFPSYGTTPNTTLGPGGFQVDAYAARSLQRCTLHR